MSFFVQTNTPEFAASENAKMRKTVHTVIAANRFRKPLHKPSIKSWYMAGIKQNRKSYSEALTKKNEYTLKPVEREISDVTWRTDDGLETFCNQTKLTEDIGSIPGMTYGLRYVLSLKEIHFVSQMLANFIKNIEFDEEYTEVSNSYVKWLKSIAKGTIAEETNMYKVTHSMAKYVEEKGLYKTYY